MENLHLGMIRLHPIHLIVKFIIIDCTEGHSAT